MLYHGTVSISRREERTTRVGWLNKEIMSRFLSTWDNDFVFRTPRSIVKSAVLLEITLTANGIQDDEVGVAP